MRQLLAAAMWAALLAGPAHADETPRPDIVVLLADDLGYADIGAYGGPVATPALDRLAAGGVRFTDFHSGSPVCSPSRATAMTGRQHVRTGVYHVINDGHHDMHLLESEVTLAELLRPHGYATAHIGKWHLGLPYRGRDKPTPDAHGFDHWFVTGNNAWPSHRDPVNFRRNGEPVGRIEGYSSHIVVDEAIAWIDSLPEGRPFFLNLWFHEPHAPIAAPPEIVAEYGEPGDPAAVYSATVDNTDRAIARLVDRLGDALDDTLIVYASDNGSYRQDRVGGLRGRKGSHFEGGHRVPGIFHWPAAIAAGVEEAEPAGMVDLLPTLAGLLGIPPPEGVHLDGADLAPLLRGQRDAFTRTQPLFWYSPEGGAALRDGSHALLGWPDRRLPKDRDGMQALFEQVRRVLEEADDPALGHGDLWTQMFNGFDNEEAERLRIRFILLNQFQEAWIPAMKEAGLDRFQLFDLAEDRAQATDVAAGRPAVFARLRQELLRIHASVLADGPDWSAVGD